MKLQAILFSCVHLMAAAPGQVLANLDHLSAHQDLRGKLHVDSVTIQVSKPKTQPVKSEADLDLQVTKGELRTHRLGGEGIVEEREIQSDLNAVPLIRQWLTKGTPLPELGTPSGAIVLQLLPDIPPHLKRLWGSSGRLELWCSPEGVPKRAKLVQSYKGRHQRIAPTEEERISIDYTFKVLGDHLIVSHQEERIEDWEGYDHHQRQRSVTLLDSPM